MKKKINFPLAIVFIISCGILLIVVVGIKIPLSGFLDESSEEQSDQITEVTENEASNSKPYAYKIETELIELKDEDKNYLTSSFGENENQGFYKNYNNEYKIKHPIEGWTFKESGNGEGDSFVLCKEGAETLYRSYYCLTGSVIYLDDEYINYDWDRESIKDFYVKGSQELYLGEYITIPIAISLDNTRKTITASGEIAQVGTGNFGVISELRELAIFPLKARTKAMVLYYYNFEDLEKTMEEKEVSDFKIEQKVREEIEEIFNQIIDTFEIIEVDNRCRYGKGEYELRVYDSDGRVTGLVNGEEKREIPRSVYFSESFEAPAEIIIFDPEDSYTYEIFGITKGNYKFNPSFVLEGVGINFSAYYIPIYPGETHRYHFDWELLARSEQGATLLIDSNKDGIFEKEIKSDKILNCEEFLEEK